MAYTNEDICTRARAFLGADVREEALSLLCSAAAEELRGRLRAGTSEEEAGDRFPLAAALLACATYKESFGAKSVKAGSVSLSYDGETPAALRRAAEALVAEFTQGGFCFMGVRG